nr:bacillithiol biosynthesis BshC [Planctomycetota bacterium]
MNERSAATLDLWPDEPWGGDAALAAAGAQLLADHTWDRAALARIVAVHANDAPARAQAAVLARPGTAAVVTGQQPAFGGGPLYSLVKTAHALALARRLGA